ncbi:unnamed protein product, partial [Staurois parvus]
TGDGTRLFFCLLFCTDLLHCYRPSLLSDLAYSTSSHQTFTCCCTTNRCLFHSWLHQGVATWSRFAPSPSPPSGALVNKQVGT